MLSKDEAAQIGKDGVNPSETPNKGRKRSREDGLESLNETFLGTDLGTDAFAMALDMPGTSATDGIATAASVADASIFDTSASDAVPLGIDAAATQPIQSAPETMPLRVPPQKKSKKSTTNPFESLPQYEIEKLSREGLPINLSSDSRFTLYSAKDKKNRGSRCLVLTHIAEDVKFKTGFTALPGPSRTQYSGADFFTSYIIACQIPAGCRFTSSNAYPTLILQPILDGVQIKAQNRLYLYSAMADNSYIEQFPSQLTGHYQSSSWQPNPSFARANLFTVSNGIISQGLNKLGKEPVAEIPVILVSGSGSGNSTSSSSSMEMEVKEKSEKSEKSKKIKPRKLFSLGLHENSDSETDTDSDRESISDKESDKEREVIRFDESDSETESDKESVDNGDVPNIRLTKTFKKDKVIYAVKNAGVVGDKEKTKEKAAEPLQSLALLEHLEPLEPITFTEELRNDARNLLAYVNKFESGTGLAGSSYRPRPHHLKGMHEWAEANLQGIKHTVVEHATATGKTNFVRDIVVAMLKYCFAEVRPSQKRTVLIVEPSVLLVHQTAERFQEENARLIALGKSPIVVSELREEPGLLDKKTVHDKFRQSDVVITTIQSLTSKYVRQKRIIPVKMVTDLILDEAHKYLSETYMIYIRKKFMGITAKAFHKNPEHPSAQKSKLKEKIEKDSEEVNCRIMALTATPFLDTDTRRTVYEMFGYKPDGSDNPVKPYRLQDAINAGTNVPMILCVANPKDCEELIFKRHIRHYKRKEENNLINTPSLNKMVVELCLNFRDPVTKYSLRGKEGIVYCANIAHAVAFADEFNQVNWDVIDPDHALRDKYKENCKKDFLEKRRTEYEASFNIEEFSAVWSSTIGITAAEEFYETKKKNFNADSRNDGKTFRKEKFESEWKRKAAELLGEFLAKYRKQCKDNFNPEDYEELWEHAWSFEYGCFEIAQDIHSGYDQEKCAKILRDFNLGRFPILIGDKKLIEGFDKPGIQFVVRACPTLSMRTLLQCIGRGERVDPNNPAKMLYGIDIAYEMSQGRKFVYECLSEAETGIPSFEFGRVQEYRTRFHNTENALQDDDFIKIEGAHEIEKLHWKPFRVDNIILEKTVEILNDFIKIVKQSIDTELGASDFLSPSVLTPSSVLNPSPLLSPVSIFKRSISSTQNPVPGIGGPARASNIQNLASKVQHLKNINDFVISILAQDKFKEALEAEDKDKSEQSSHMDYRDESDAAQIKSKTQGMESLQKVCEFSRVLAGAFEKCKGLLQKLQDKSLRTASHPKRVSGQSLELSLDLDLESSFDFDRVTMLQEIEKIAQDHAACLAILESIKEIELTIAASRRSTPIKPPRLGMGLEAHGSSSTAETDEPRACRKAKSEAAKAVKKMTAFMQESDDEGAEIGDQEIDNEIDGEWTEDMEEEEGFRKERRPQAKPAPLLFLQQALELQAMQRQMQTQMPHVRSTPQTLSMPLLLQASHTMARPYLQQPSQAMPMQFVQQHSQSVPRLPIQQPPQTMPMSMPMPLSMSMPISQQPLRAEPSLLFSGRAFQVAESQVVERGELGSAMRPIQPGDGMDLDEEFQAKPISRVFR